MFLRSLCTGRESFGERAAYCFSVENQTKINSSLCVVALSTEDDEDEEGKKRNGCQLRSNEEMSPSTDDTLIHTMHN